MADEENGLTDEQAAQIEQEPEGAPDSFEPEEGE